MNGLILLVAATMGNAYDSSQLEEILALATTSETAEVRIQAYTAAYFLTRINMGLYSEQQLPIIEELIILTDDIDWRYRKNDIISRVYGRTSVESVEAVDSLARYKINTFSEFKDLTDAEEMYGIVGLAGKAKLLMCLGLANARISIISYLTSQNLDFWSAETALELQDLKNQQLTRYKMQLIESMHEAEEVMDSSNVEEYNRLAELMNEM
jgi:hypothetical protein